MFKTLIAGVTALSLTISPLQAEEFNNDDFGKFLFGLVAAGIVASALSQRNDNKSDDVERRQVHQPALPPAFNLDRHEPPVVQHRNTLNAPRLNPGAWNDRGGLPHRGNGWGHNPRQNAKVLPRACFRSVETRYGTQNMFARRCLTQNYRYAASLPQRCAVRVLARNTAFNGYDPQCLRSEGYTSTARR